MAERPAGRDGEGRSTTWLIVAGVVAMLFLCACCAGFLLLAWFYGDAVVEALGIGRLVLPSALFL